MKYIDLKIPASSISLQRLLLGCRSSGWPQNPSTSDASPQPVMSGCSVSLRTNSAKTFRGFVWGHKAGKHTRWHTASGRWLVNLHPKQALRDFTKW